MHDIYNFVSGPLVWIAFILFIGGSLYQLISRAILASKKDQAVYSYMSLFLHCDPFCTGLFPLAV